MRLIWLSHILDEDTPLYGGASGINIEVDRALAGGDSCNTTVLTFPSHAGSHVDAPYHFLKEGKTVDLLPPETWVFTAPLLIDMHISPTTLIEPDFFSLRLSSYDSTDLILLRTGFERFRGGPVYWEDGPGLSPLLAKEIRQIFPQLRAIGIDFISISSQHHREQGRLAHRAFLEQKILLFEDLSLLGVNLETQLAMVVALPLRVKGGDGAPCTILGWLGES
jgi:kynurenine formamidase